MEVVKLLKDAIPWFFSGIGVFIIGLIIHRQKNKVKKEIKQNQRISKNSYGIQAGGNIEINMGEDKK